jgi:phage terminase small subunit
MPQRRHTSPVVPALIVADPPPPPNHLQPETAAWWRDVVAEFAFEQHQYRTLQCGAEAFDRKEQARQILAREGLSYTDDKGMIRARPEVAIERDSRNAYLRAMRELNLEHVKPPSNGQTWRDIKERYR